MDANNISMPKTLYLSFRTKWRIYLDKVYAQNKEKFVFIRVHSRLETE